jgi:hypothetical protein
MTGFRDTIFATGRAHLANVPRGLRRFAAAASAFLTRSRRSCSSRYSVSIELSNLFGALGLVR